MCDILKPWLKWEVPAKNIDMHGETHRRDACGTRPGKEKTGLVSQGMAEEAGEFRMSTT